MKLKISSLMDEYTDTEFFPEGGSAVSPEAVKARVLASVSVQPKKKQMPRRKKVLLAAAFAAAMLVLAGAGYPFIQRQLVSGSLVFGQDGSRGFVENRIMEVEDGRLLFTPKGKQRVDITDLVSEKTPYIYDGSDPDTGLTYYIIMGGTPECYGWFTWVYTPNPFYNGATSAKYETAYDFTIFNGEDHSGHMGMGGMNHIGIVEWWDNMDHPWLLAGAERLGITFVPAEEFEAMVEAEAR